MERATRPAVEEPPTEPLHGVGKLRLDRIAIGLLVVGVGIAWFLDLAGVSVPWRLLPAIGLMLVGLLLLFTVLGHLGRGGLIGLGIALTILAAIGVSDAGRYAGPVGDRTIAPSVSDWPVDVRLGAGDLTIDLTENPLPRTGRLEANVGAGRILVIRPSDARVRIDAEVSVGEITVAGRRIESGTSVDWQETTPAGPAVVLDLNVGTGSIEVHDE